MRKNSWKIIWLFQKFCIPSQYLSILKGNPLKNICVMKKQTFELVEEMISSLKRTPQFHDVVSIAYHDEKLMKALRNVAMTFINEYKMGAGFIFEDEIKRNDNFIVAINTFLSDNEIELTRLEGDEFRWEMANFIKVVLQDTIITTWDAIKESLR